MYHSLDDIKNLSYRSGSFEAFLWVVACESSPRDNPKDGYELKGTERYKKLAEKVSRRFCCFKKSVGTKIGQLKITISFPSSPYR